MDSPTNGYEGGQAIIGWILLAAFAAVCLSAPFVPQVAAISWFLNTPILLAFAAWHGHARYGWKAMLVGALVVFVVAMTLEIIGIATGWPYGNFHHSDFFGVKLLGVPLFVGLSWCTMAYPGWTMANLFLRGADADGRGSSVWLLPLIALFVPLAIDLSFEPIGATLLGTWVYHDGGGYFGIPLRNFFGVALTQYLSLQIVAILLLRGGHKVQVDLPTGWWLQPAILVGIYALIPVLSVLTQPAAFSVTDAAGTSWRSRDIFESLAAISMISMAFMALLGIALASRRT